ncbi:hypothetical protein BHM03_00048080, partial [Ensete ventricosum]
ELKEKHQRDLQKLTLTTQPFKTLRLFFFAILQYLKQTLLYVLKKGGWLMGLTILLATFSLFLVNGDGTNEKHVQEFIRYTRFGLWWVALGVASSIGLGSGLHTFVLYLGPHIAFFTIKAMKCGRVDLKSAPYDTIQLKRRPLWLEKNCSEFGPPLYQSLPGSLVKVPISSILPQVQLEAILWGLGTALGELPPYFISRAARLSGSNLEMEDLGSASSTNGFVSSSLRQIKIWLLTHSQHLNFLTILVLASVPNPLFDLAGIMCGQFGISFLKFFVATLIGKALIKTHIQAACFLLHPQRLAPLLAFMLPTQHDISTWCSTLQCVRAVVDAMSAAMAIHSTFCILRPPVHLLCHHHRHQSRPFFDILQQTRATPSIAKPMIS